MKPRKGTPRLRMAKTKMLGIRMTPELFERLAKRADRADQMVSGYVRQLIRADLGDAL